jgi:hypothetical protein
LGGAKRKASKVWVEKYDQVGKPYAEFGKAAAAMPGVFGVPDDSCLDPFESGGKVLIVVESLSERGESNATCLSWRGGEKESPDNRRQFH